MVRRPRLPRTRPVVAASAAIAAATTAVLTRGGVLIGGDSGTYLRSAAWFRSDLTLLFNPPSHTDLSVRDLFPPGYSIALALTDGWLSPRWMGVLMAAATVGLVAALVDRFASTRAAIAVTALLVVARGWLLVLFGFVMSDGLHLLLAVAAVAALVPALDRATDDRGRTRSVVLSSLAASGALGTRYAGLGVVAGIAAATASFVPTPRPRRIRLTASSVAIGIVPTAAWRFVVSLTGPGEQRTFGIRKLDGEQWDLIDTMARTYLPRQLTESTTMTRAIGLPILLTIAVWSVAVLRAAARSTATTSERVAASLLLVGWGHHAALAYARVFSDRNVTIGGRYALAWWTFIVAAAALDLYRRLQRTGRARVGRVAAAAAVGVLLVGGSPAFVRTVHRPTEAWSNYSLGPPSLLIPLLEARVPDRLIVYTNKEDSVWFATGRETLRLPRRLDHYTGALNQRFDAELERLRRDVVSGRAVAVVFADDNGGFPPATRRLRGTQVVTAGADGFLIIAAARP